LTRSEQPGESASFRLTFALFRHSTEGEGSYQLPATGKNNIHGKHSKAKATAMRENFLRCSLTARGDRASDADIGCECALAGHSFPEWNRGVNAIRGGVNAVEKRALTPWKFRRQGRGKRGVNATR
jgi:hypothetical protein